MCWFRQDLRVADNPAMLMAARLGAVVPLFVLGPDEEEGNWPLGGASRYWLHHSLDSLGSTLQRSITALLLCLTMWYA